MATLSTLELMLQEIQNQENLDPYGYAHHHQQPPPPLPPRPVSKGRVSVRKPRKTVLSIQLQEFDRKKREVVDNKSKRTKRGAFAFVEEENYHQENGEEIEGKGIVGIQKYFRGYQARLGYHKLKQGIITLQSFIRGENARRKFQYLKNQETIIIYLQSVVRGWLCRRRLDYRLHMSIKNTKQAPHDLQKEKLTNKGHVAVSSTYILDLEEQVLRMETALQNKKDENLNLELHIQQIDRKWQLHKAKMDSMEKTWQDEFTSIQVNLASVRTKMRKEITHLPLNCLQENEKVNLTIREILQIQEKEMYDMDSGFHLGDRLENVLDSRRYLEEELRKLKGRFKAWKKDFKVRLKEIKGTFEMHGHSKTKKIKKGCCVR